MNRLAKSLVSIVAICFATGIGSAAAAQRIAVVELFTSQGCASCPPVDEMVGGMAAADKVLVLSFHVDYWDYTGWKDPFSSRDATARQKGYSRALKKGYVYTPQIIIDGVVEITGQGRGAIEAQIRLARQRPKLDITITSADDGLVDIHIPAAPYRGLPADIWVAVYDRRVETQVWAGENEGKTLVNNNVVRAFQRVGRWRGAEVKLTLPLTALGGRGRDGCAILVQQQGLGPILGAKNVLLADGRR